MKFIVLVLFCIVGVNAFVGGRPQKTDHARGSEAVIAQQQQSEVHVIESSRPEKIRLGNPIPSANCSSYLKLVAGHYQVKGDSKVREEHRQKKKRRETLYQIAITKMIMIALMINSRHSRMICFF
jgi:hypothetical protein